MSGDALQGKADGVSVDVFRHVLQQVTLPVAIIACQVKGGRSAVTATAVSCASTDPPLLLVSLNRASATADAISECGTFSVNFLAWSQSALARAFSSGERTDQLQFAEDDWRRSAVGPPILRNAIGVFDCRVNKTFVCGSSRVFLGSVVAAVAQEGQPLLYRDGYFRRLAVE